MMDWPQQPIPSFYFWSFSFTEYSVSFVRFFVQSGVLGQITALNCNSYYRERGGICPRDRE